MSKIKFACGTVRIARWLIQILQTILWKDSSF